MKIQHNSELVLLNISEVADVLNVSTATLYRWRSEKRNMPRATRVGGRVLWTKAAVYEWLETQAEELI